MAIDFRCTSCGKLLRVGDDAAGREAQCPQCGNRTIVPAAGGTGSASASVFSPVAGGSATGPEALAKPVPPTGADALNPFQSPTQAGGPLPLDMQMGGDWYQYALNRVAGPAIALIVTGALGGLMNFVGIILNVFNVVVGQGFRGGNVHGDPALAMFSGVGGIVGGIVGLIMALLVIAGAIKMKNLSSYGLAMTAAIVAVIPCVSPCCLLGLPFGIWALVVLNEENVKAAFYQPLLPPG